ncbi:MAG: GDP-mannose 4,6-dehydratase [Acidobacteria bacterium]|nr:GDP-mannose 4,6-dehydratase [Acidobacteriota bacterium]
MTTRYLITGAQGFIGRYLAQALLHQDPKCQVLGLGRSPRCDRFFTHSVHLQGHRVAAPLPPDLSLCQHDRYRYVALDIQKTGSLVSLLSDYEPSVVFHLASGLRDNPPDQLCRANIEGTVSLLQAIVAANHCPQKIVLGSSGGIYGVPQRLPIAETEPCRPIDIYSVTKLASEQISAILARDHQLPVCWARIFNVVGAGQEERHVVGRFAAQLTAMDAKMPCQLQVGRLDTTRDFIDIRDVITALILLSQRGEPSEAYNIGSGRETAIGDILHLLQERMAIAFATETVYSRPADIARHFADIQKIQNLGFYPRFSLQESIEAVLAYYCSPERVCL